MRSYPTMHSMALAHAANRSCAVMRGGATLVLLVSFAACASAALPAGHVRLAGNLPAAIARATALGPLGSEQEVAFAITLPLRDEAGLDELLRRLYTPGDPLYHQFLKTGEFAERFGPPQADYDSVAAWAELYGLRVTARHANRTVLDVAGRVRTVESALGIHMLRYQSPAGRSFRGPDAEPSLPAAIAARVSGIADLDDAMEPRSNLVQLPPGPGAGRGAAPARAAGTGPVGGLSPGDVKVAYNLNGLAQNGAGQSIALLERDGYLAGDITTYENQFGLANVPLINVLLNGVTGTPTAATATVPFPTGPLEVTLDIELAIALAPGASLIWVYEGNSYVDLYNRIASDNVSRQVSSSWYYDLDWATPAAIRNAENTAFRQMATQGQSFYAATGDFGDQVKTGTDLNGNPIFQFGVQDPSAQPWCTAVGGSIVTLNPLGTAWQSETAWSGSTGGVSTTWTIPTYQSAVVPAGSNGSSTYRNLPDVCLDSASGYSIYFYGAWTGSVGGTSCAAPLWAAYTALVNQYRAGAGLAPLGFLNPTLYYLAHTPAYATDFHDITTGNNGTYPAGTGYDNVTGWGSFNGGALFADIMVNAKAIWVDGLYTGPSSLGTADQPFKTLTAAVNAASPTQPTIIYIKGGFHYFENLSISSNIIIINNGSGDVTVGN